MERSSAQTTRARDGARLVFFNSTQYISTFILLYAQKTNLDHRPDEVLADQNPRSSMIDFSIIDLTIIDISTFMVDMYGSTPHRNVTGRMGFLLVRLANTVRTTHGAHLAPLGIGLTDAWSLVLIRDGRATRPGDLAQTLGVDPAGITRMVKKLAGKGLVRRSRHGDDLRSVHLELTPKAGEVLSRIDSALEVAEKGLLDTLPAADASALERLLGERRSASNP